MLNDFIQQFLPSTVGGLAIGAIYALVALGYTMVYGVLRLINFAHSEIFMIGTLRGAVRASPRSASTRSADRLRPVRHAAAADRRGRGGRPAARRSLLERGRLPAAAQARRAPAGRARSPRSARRCSCRSCSRCSSSRRCSTGQAASTPRCRRHRRPRRAVHHRQRRRPHRPGASSWSPRSIDDDRCWTSWSHRTRIGRGIRATAQDPEAAVLMGVNIDTHRPADVPARRRDGRRRRRALR